MLKEFLSFPMQVHFDGGNWHRKGGTYSTFDVQDFSELVEAVDAGGAIHPDHLGDKVEYEFMKEHYEIEAEDQSSVEAKPKRGRPRLS